MVVLSPSCWEGPPRAEPRLRRGCPGGISPTFQSSLPFGSSPARGSSESPRSFGRRHYPAPHVVDAGDTSAAGIVPQRTMDGRSKSDVFSDGGRGGRGRGRCGRSEPPTRLHDDVPIKTVAKSPRKSSVVRQPNFWDMPAETPTKGRQMACASPHGAVIRERSAPAAIGKSANAAARADIATVDCQSGGTADAPETPRRRTSTAGVASPLWAWQQGNATRSPSDSGRRTPRGVRPSPSASPRPDVPGSAWGFSSRRGSRKGSIGSAAPPPQTPRSPRDAQFWASPPPAAPSDAQAVPSQAPVPASPAAEPMASPSGGGSSNGAVRQRSRGGTPNATPRRPQAPPLVSPLRSPVLARDAHRPVLSHNSTLSSEAVKSCTRWSNEREPPPRSRQQPHLASTLMESSMSQEQWGQESAQPVQTDSPFRAARPDAEQRPVRPRDFTNHSSQLRGCIEQRHVQPVEEGDAFILPAAVVQPPYGCEKGLAGPARSQSPPTPRKPGGESLSPSIGPGTCLFVTAEALLVNDEMQLRGGKQDRSRSASRETLNAPGADGPADEPSALHTLMPSDLRGFSKRLQETNAKLKHSLYQSHVADRERQRPQIKRVSLGSRPGSARVAKGPARRSLSGGACRKTDQLLYGGRLGEKATDRTCYNAGSQVRVVAPPNAGASLRLTMSRGGKSKFSGDDLSPTPATSIGTMTPVTERGGLSAESTRMSNMS